MRHFFIVAFLTLVISINLDGQWTTSGNNIYNSNTGNVGIGTSSPATRLEVKSPIDAFSTGTQYVGSLGIGWTNDYGAGQAAQWLLLTPYISGSNGNPAAGLNGTLTFFRGSTTTGNINVEYHVNIQAAYSNTISSLIPLSSGSPVIALHVVTLTTGGTFVAIDPADFSGGHSSGNISYSGYYWNNFAAPQNIKPQLVLQSAATENTSLKQSWQPIMSNRMYVNTSGNIGIGTSSPQAKLDIRGGNLWINAPNSLPNFTDNYALNVNGNIRANKLVVNTTGADFVFDSCYKLMPLEQVERYIKQNQHLPGIATAKDMQRKGVDVGQNQTALLQKVEELTLYIISQQKEKDELKVRLNQQEELLRKLEEKIDNLTADK